MLAAGLVLACTQSAPTVHDPLPSWNDTAPKKAIMAFVEKVTENGSQDFVPVPERIATSTTTGRFGRRNPYPSSLYSPSTR